MGSALVLPATLLALAGLVALATGPLTPGVVHAGEAALPDLDQDGLSNEAEHVLGTQEGLVDTDGDGFCDLEEFARGSDPRTGASTPLPGGLSLNMSSSGEDSGLFVQVALHYRDDDLSDKHLHLGLLAGGEARFVPSLMTQVGVLTTHRQTLDGAGDVLLVDVPVPENMIHNLGDVSVFAAVAVDGQPGFVAAAGVDLYSRDGVVHLLQRPRRPRYSRASFQQSGQQQQGSAGGASSGAVYVPIAPGGGGLPSTWNPGEICYQATIQVANTGGIVSHEVIAADCIEGWDAYCRSDCSSSVGEVFQTFDPIGLVGN